MDIGDVQPGAGYDIQLPNKKFLLTSESDPENLPEGAWLVDKESPTGWKESSGDLKVNYKISEIIRNKLLQIFQNLIGFPQLSLHHLFGWHCLLVGKRIFIHADLVILS